MRDSEEYAALARQVYRMAGEAVTRSAASAGRQPWAVVLDVDETALDNSTYELERAAYHLPYDPRTWNAWVSRREAGAVPGVVEFVALVRRAGGHVAWITNRDRAAGRRDTRESSGAEDVGRRRSPVRAEKSGAHEGDRGAPKSYPERAIARGAASR